MASKIQTKKWENIDATITPKMIVKMKFTQSTPDIKITATKPWSSDHELYKLWDYVKEHKCRVNT
jgi:hypothetical protein